MTVRERERERDEKRWTKSEEIITDFILPPL